MKLGFPSGFELIKTAIDGRREELFIKRWIAGYQHINFDEFKNAAGYVQRMEAVSADAGAVLTNVYRIIGAIRGGSESGTI